ncbi:hypothetical protein ACWDB3_32495 [Streptomyces bacillaris]
MNDGALPPIFLFDDEDFLYVFDSVDLLSGWLEEFTTADACFDSTGREIDLLIDEAGGVKIVKISDSRSEEKMREKLGRYFSRHLKTARLPAARDLGDLVREVVDITGSMRKRS